MPAAEIVGAVEGVQHPLKVDMQGPPDHPLHEQFAHFGGDWRIAIVKGDAQGAASSFDGFKDRTRFGGVDGHRLFGNGVTAKFHRSVDIEMVGGIHAGDNDGVRFGFGHHAVKIVGAIGGNRGGVELLSNLLVVPVHARLAQITEADHDGVVLIGADNGVDKHLGAAPRPHQCISFTWFTHGNSLTPSLWFGNGSF